MRSLVLCLLSAVTFSTVAPAQNPTSSIPAVMGGPSALISDVPGVTRKFVTVNGARLQYLDFGGSGEPIVLLAGMGNTAWIWSDFGQQLAQKGFRVVALTRRAHGESESPQSGYNVDTLAADVVALMDSLSIQRAHLVGHSLAGVELTRIASQYPDRVLRLVYLDAAYDRAAQQRYDAAVLPPQFAPPMTDADRSSIDAYLAYQHRARLDLARFWSPAVERDYIASLAVDSLGHVSWRHPFIRYGQILQDASRAAPDYSKVTAPALALYATVSQAIAPPDASAEKRAQLARFESENNHPWTAASIAQFRSGVKNGSVKEIAGVHHLFLDRPGETLDAIVQFLRASKVAAQPSRTQIVLLGTGTPIPDPDRSGPAIAIVVDSVAYLFDAGAGVSRRATAAGIKGVKAFAARTPSGQPSPRFDRIFITHLHSDHTLGLADAIFSPIIQGRATPVDIYGPPGIQHLVTSIFDGNKEDIEERRHAFGGPPSNAWNAIVHEIKAGEVFRDSRITVTAFAVPHADWKYAFGYKIQTPDGVIVLSGDTRPSDAIEKQCNECDVLVHEVYSDAGFANLPALRQKYHAHAHTSGTQLGDIATRAKPKLLILSHQLFFGSSDEKLLSEVRSHFSGQVVSGKDLDIYPVPQR